MMTKRSMMRKLLRARVSLNQTVQQILDINRKRKRLPYTNNPTKKGERLQEELKVLNKTAEHQALLVRRYQQQLNEVA